MESKAQVVDQTFQEAGVLYRLGQLDARKRKAWRRGAAAKESGFMRVSPYYEDAGADAAWFAGYDGKVEPTLDEILGPALGPAIGMADGGEVDASKSVLVGEHVSE